MIKKIKYILIIFILFMPTIALATSVAKVSDINKTPALETKKHFYITDMSNYKITINDTKNFKIINDKYGYKQNIAIHSKPTKTTTYDDPYYVTWENIGYYIDDNNQPVYLNARINISRLILVFGETLGTTRYTVVAHISGNNSFIFDVRNSDKDYNFHASIIGAHDYFTFELLDQNNELLDENIANELYVKWKISDLDGSDALSPANGYSSSCSYCESVKFNTGFNDTFYVLKSTLLNYNSGGTRFRATTRTGNESTDPSSDRSTVVAYQITNSASGEWWSSSGSATAIQAINREYPYFNGVEKKADKKKYAVGDIVSYTIKNRFPYTINTNAAKSIKVVDEFDKALDITNLTYKVIDSNNKNVTNDWTLTKSKQKVTLAYNKTAFTEVVGNYTFQFDNIKVLQPDDTHKTVNSSQMEGIQ